MKIALCLLTLNEEACLQKIFPNIPSPDAGGYDFLCAVDGGSTDGTLEFFRDHGVKVIAQSKRGRGQAFLEVFNAVDADAFIFFSPDGNENPADIPKFSKYLAEGAEIVIASRMMKESVNEEDDLIFKWRKWANNFFNFIANFFFRKTGPFITDSINGYRAIRKATAKKLGLTAQDYTIEYQMTIKGLKARAKIVEFPTIEGARVAGETGAPSIPTGIKFIKRFLTELFARN